VTLRAVTVIRPWSDAVVSGGKRVENRTWKPPEAIVGSVIALHAGANYERPHVIPGWKPPAPHESPQGVVALVRVLGHVTRAVQLPADQWRWFHIADRNFGWVLELVAVLARPVPCKGRLSLWHVPQDVEREIARQAGPW